MISNGMLSADYALDTTDIIVSRSWNNPLACPKNSHRVMLVSEGLTTPLWSSDDGLHWAKTGAASLGCHVRSISGSRRCA
jgi:hypothetical protein